MRRTVRVLACALLPLLSTGIAAAQRPGDSPPPREKGETKPVDAPPSKQKLAPIALGTAIDPAVGWLDAGGKAATLGEQKGKTVVLFFVGRASPATAAWGKRFKKLAELYKDAPVVFVALDANADDCEDKSVEARKRLAQWATEQGFARFGLDPERALADRFSVATNGHALVIDAAQKFVYSGVLDDDFKGDQEARALRHIRAALDAVLAGKAPERASTPALGDPIVREVKRPTPAPKPDSPKPDSKRPR
ncbi:MAG: redoxin family protein [Planctomycetes bacterium]|nr:redoxin family protein [Planctomycetota bacterium]